MFRYRNTGVDGTCRTRPQPQLAPVQLAMALSLVMRAVVLVVSVFALACGSVHGPEGACSTAADCASSAPFCVDQRCEAHCQVNADCTGAGKSVCASDGACVACQVASDCTDAAAPLCTTDNVCVGCLSAADCTDAAAPVCDATARSCRGCTADADCSGGVCIEATGTCAPDASVVFLTMMGTDSGTCTRDKPCVTVPYAIAHAAARKIFHILGNTLTLSAPVVISSEMTFDGEDTSIFAGGGMSFNVTGTASATLEGLHLAAPTTGTTPPAAVNITDTAQATLYNDTFVGPTSVSLSTGPKVLISHSHFGSLDAGGESQITCNGGQLTVERNIFETTTVGNFMQCDLTVRRNRFESASDGSVHLAGGRLLMENNLIIHRDGFNDSIFANTLSTGSTIRFNTIVNTTAVSSDGAALGCDGSVVVTSNVFAYYSGHPITGSCVTRYSVFDTVSLTSAGVGNKTADINSIFVNRAGGDYHLSATSAARGSSEAGLTTMVTDDFDGNPRPAPAGSTADSGAFEAN